MGESTDKIEATDVLQTAPGADHSAASETTDVAELRRNIEETRDDLSQTIDALQERLNPATIKQQVTDATIGKAEDLARTAATQAKAKTAPIARLAQRYPIPFAIAAGMALLLVARLLMGRSDADEIDDEDADVEEIDLYGPVYEDNDLELYEIDD